MGSSIACRSKRSLPRRAIGKYAGASAECQSSRRSGVEPLASKAAVYELQHVYALENPALAQYTPEGYTAALESLIRALRPDYVIFPHTYQVRDFAPVSPPASGRHSFQMSSISDAQRRERPVFVRQLFQGKLNADARVQRAEAMVRRRFRPDRIRADRAESGRAAAARWRSSAPGSPKDALKQAGRAISGERPSARPTAAELIVSVGRGIREQENFSAGSGTR